ncbi:hypothetical protein RSAG8_07002, partial [Rhizoctonia solani AG-8 WAC10335]
MIPGFCTGCSIVVYLDFTMLRTKCMLNPNKLVSFQRILKYGVRRLHSLFTVCAGLTCASVIIISQTCRTCDIGTHLARMTGLSGFTPPPLSLDSACVLLRPKTSSVPAVYRPLIAFWFHYYSLHLKPQVDPKEPCLP